MIEDLSISVWLDDTDPLFRLGLAASLERGGFRVAGQSAGFAPTPRSGQFDVLVFELSESAMDQVGAVVRRAATGLVATVERPDDSLVSNAVTLGVAGILVRDDITPESIVHCVHSVAVGNASLPVATLVAMLGPSTHRARRYGLDLFTEREINVLRLVAEGRTVREVAAELSYSEKTVKNTVHDLLVRTGLRNREEAIAVLTRQGAI